MLPGLHLWMYLCSYLYLYEITVEVLHVHKHEVAVSPDVVAQLTHNVCGIRSIFGSLRIAVFRRKAEQQFAACEGKRHRK